MSTLNVRYTKWFPALIAASAALLSTGARANGAAKPVELQVSRSEIVENVDLRDSSGQILTLRVPTPDQPAIPGVDYLDPDRIDTGVAPLDTARALCGDYSVDNSDMSQRQAAARSSLTSIILQLEALQPPRHLSDDQRNALSQIPLCEPFLGQLRTITRYLHEGLNLANQPAQPARPGFRMNVSGIAFFNEKNTGAGFLGLRVDKQIAYFRLDRPVEINKRGRPVNLQWVGATPQASGQGLGVAVQALQRVPGTCVTTYQLNLTNPQGGATASLQFAVDEERCP